MCNLILCDTFIPINVFSTIASIIFVNLHFRVACGYFIHWNLYGKRGSSIVILLNLNFCVANLSGDVVLP